ncbi:hypothetical protein [Alginatibacterium sediminis]|uniref:hypothetical protein n=1 Tax=Alginatibacterium sediminis TaxID=2164068 RepID=UPI0011C35DA1|nr:hypothetical protein [Alginatibacterium sediminis]
MKLLLAGVLLVLSSVSNATIITHGDLVTDDTTKVITQVSTGRQYTRFDTFDLSYAQTIEALEPSESYFGWNIATSAVADDFINAALGSDSSLCDGQVAYFSFCGQIVGWSDGDFGESYLSDSDYFAYLTSAGALTGTNIISLFEITSNGVVYDYENWSTDVSLDVYSSGRNGRPINLLLYKDFDATDPTAVTEPTSLVILSLSIFGLVAARARKKA